MKNKIYTAMLLGMSASMAVPSTAVFAAEETAEVVTETAAEAQEEETEEDETEDTVADESAQMEEPGEAPTLPEESEDESLLEESTPTVSMNDYATNEEAKLADTPGDFWDFLMLVCEKITPEIFGKYNEPLVEYIKSNDVNTSSLYDCEMSMVKKAEELAAEDNEDVAKAMKYQMALIFEHVYGESAFQAGRDVRRSIVTDKDDEFELCSTIADIDGVYTLSDGIKATPAELFAAESPETPESPENPLSAYVQGMVDMQVDRGTDVANIKLPEVTFDENVVSDVHIDIRKVNPYASGTYDINYVITGKDGREEIVTKQCVVAQKQAANLASYVQGIADIQMTVGEEIPTPEVTFDENYVSRVDIDTSRVVPREAGEYDIFYDITGVNGEEEAVKKQCVVTAVTEDHEELRKKMCTKIDEINDGSLTEKAFQDKWADESNKAKGQIYTMTDEDAMQDVVDAAKETFAQIVSAQQLSVAKNGYISIITSFIDQLTFKTDTQKAMAEEAMKEAIANIEKAETVDAAAKALDAGKTKMKEIAEENESSIAELKNEAKEKIDAMKAEISDSTTITTNVYDAITKRLDACETAKEVDSVSNSADKAFKAVKGIVDGDLTLVTDLYKALKGVATDSDTTSTIDVLIGLDPTEDVKEAESRIKDACMALTLDTENFTEYVSKKAEESITGSTKTEVYTKFIEIVANKPIKELETIKETAREGIDKILESIDETFDEIKVKKEEIKAEADKLLAEADSKEKVDAVVETVKEKAEALSKEAGELKQLKSLKDSAKESIQKAVDGQENEELRAELQKLADSVCEAIDNDKTEQEIKDHLETFKKDAEEIIKVFKENAALAAAKADALKKLTDLESQANKEFETTEMKDIMKKARDDVDAAKTIDECSQVYSKAKEDYRAAYLTGMKAVYAGKVDNLLKDIKFTNKLYQEKADEVISKQKENINQATDEKTMQNCLSLAKKQIEKLVEMQKNDMKLAQIKVNAINQLKSAYSNPSANGAKILNSYIDKIQNATSEDDVNKLVSECKKSMNTAGETEDKNNTVAKLVKAKSNAISSLNNMMGSIPMKYQNDAKAELVKYVNSINAATTEEEVARLLDEGIQALKKFGGNPNDAKPNPDTDTDIDINGDGYPDYDVNGDGKIDVDLDGDGIPDVDLNGDGIPDKNQDLDGDGKPDGENYASQKGNADVTSAGNVKTGDVNMGIIAIAGASIMAALAAAIFSIRRFLKK